MAKYRNTAANKIIISGMAGRLMEIAPGAIVELDANIARRGFPYLQPVVETSPQRPVSKPQMLVEAPLPISTVTDGSSFDEPKVPKKPKKKKEKTEVISEQPSEELV